MATKKEVKAAPAAKVLTPSERLNAMGIESICEYVANGASLRSWCLVNGFNQRTVLNWIEADEGRATHYACAKDDRADLAFEQLDDVSEQAVTAETAVEVAGLRLKSDNIKWKLARMNAKKYGDRQQLDHSGQVDITLFDGEQAKRMAQMLTDGH